MISTRWLERRKPYWNRLVELTDRCDRNRLESLTRSELRELAFLYRQVATDLSALREDPASQQFARYLNQLLSRAHNIIYAGRKSSARDIYYFYRYTFPRIFRRNFRYVMATVGLFVLGALIGMLLTITRPEFMHQMLGSAMVDTIERHEMWTHSVLAMKPVASSGIMTNNLSVSFITFASGISAGVGTLYFIVFNGLLMGVIGAACWLNTMSLPLWSFVAPHGALELPAIFIAGAAGFRIAVGMLFPGNLPRKQSLVVGGAVAVRLVLGTIPLLIVAGILEGFFSPTNAPLPLKFAVSGLMFALLCAYVMLPDDALAADRDSDETALLDQ
jgi:uncharacterized membrane protein SpoIIM required for sporulation